MREEISREQVLMISDLGFLLLLVAGMRWTYTFAMVLGVIQCI